MIVCLVDLRTVLGKLWIFHVSVNPLVFFRLGHQYPITQVTEFRQYRFDLRLQEKAHVLSNLLRDDGSHALVIIRSG